MRYDVEIQELQLELDKYEGQLSELNKKTKEVEYSINRVKMEIESFKFNEFKNYIGNYILVNVHRGDNIINYYMYVSDVSPVIVTDTQAFLPKFTGDITFRGFVFFNGASAVFQNSSFTENVSSMCISTLNKDELCRKLKERL